MQTDGPLFLLRIVIALVSRSLAGYNLANFMEAKIVLAHGARVLPC